MPWRIGRKLEWLGSALQSPSGQGPSEFDDSPVTPVLDVLQGGAANAPVTQIVQNLTGPLAANDVTIIAPNRELTRMIWLSLVHNLGATTIETYIALVPPLDANRRIFVGKLDLNPATTQGRRGTMTQYFGQAQPLVVLPGCGLVFGHNGIAAAEELHLRAIVLEAPAGSKVW